jgi:hypothetical protein
MKFKHPVTMEDLTVTCPVPEDMKKIIDEE